MQVLAQEVIFVSEIRCLDSNCTYNTACTTAVKSSLGAPGSPANLGCVIDGSCYSNCTAIPPNPGCFNVTSLGNTSSDTWLNFSDTPVGLTTYKKIKVFDYGVSLVPTFNTGTLSFNTGSPEFTIINASDPTKSITGGSAATLAYNETTEFWVRFSPTSPGGKVATITATSDAVIGGAACTNTTVKFNGNAVVRTPKNIVLTMDRSGSMSAPFDGTPGHTAKIELLKTAASLFLDLGDASDKFGAVRYDDTYQSQALNTSVAALKTWITGLSPGGSTGIGDALKESYRVLNGGSNSACDGADALPDDKGIIVLLTDGIENEDPYVDQSKPGHLESFPCLRQASIYTIGLGLGSQLNEAMLSYLPQLSAFAFHGGDRGYYHVQNDITSPGTSLFNLDAAFYKIYASANDIQNIVDPTVEVALNDSSSRIIHKAAVTTSDLTATFAVFEQDGYKTMYELDLLSPDGVKVVNGTLSNGLSVTTTEEPGYRIYRVSFAGAATPAAYSGTWNLRFTPKVGAAPTRKEMPATIPIGFAASTFSNLKINTQVEATLATPGNDIRYVVSLKESGIPLTKSFLDVKVKSPSGIIYPAIVTRDNDGNWLATFSNTFEVGTYEFHTKAVVYNRKGEVATREGTQFIAMAPGIQPEAAMPCIPCGWIKVIIFAVVVVVVILLISFLMRK
jgi:hypothetical protein